jgi:hypothetical protein
VISASRHRHQQAQAIRATYDKLKLLQRCRFVRTACAKQRRPTASHGFLHTPQTCFIDDTNEHTQNSNAIPEAQHSSCCFKFEWGCHCHLQGYRQSAYFTCCSALPEGQDNTNTCTVWDLGGRLAKFVHHATCLLPTALASRTLQRTAAWHANAGALTEVLIQNFASLKPSPVAVRC